MRTKPVMRVIFYSAFFVFIQCYSLTGSSLSPAVKTAYINTFPNISSLQNPNLSQTFTNSLKDIFSQRTNLNISSIEGDIDISGEIVNYEVSPINVGVGTNGQEQANQNKLTISIHVRYENKIEPEKSWDKNFIDSEPFAANQTLETVQDGLVETINTRLINQIFNAIVADW